MPVLSYQVDSTLQDHFLMWYSQYAPIWPFAESSCCMNTFPAHVLRFYWLSLQPATDSDSFKGNIKVCVCITRPINMSLSSRPTSIYEALHREAELSPQASPSNTVVTHEQIPQNAVVSLHTDRSVFTRTGQSLHTDRRLHLDLLFHSRLTLCD